MVHVRRERATPVTNCWCPCNCTEVLIGEVVGALHFGGGGVILAYSPIPNSEPRVT